MNLSQTEKGNRTKQGVNCYLGFLMSQETGGLISGERGGGLISEIKNCFETSYSSIDILAFDYYLKHRNK